MAPERAGTGGFRPIAAVSVSFAAPSNKKKKKKIIIICTTSLWKQSGSARRAASLSRHGAAACQAQGAHRQEAPPARPGPAAREQHPVPRRAPPSTARRRGALSPPSPAPDPRASRRAPKIVHKKTTKFKRLQCDRKVTVKVRDERCIRPVGFW